MFLLIFPQLVLNTLFFSQQKIKYYCVFVETVKTFEQKSLNK